MEVVSVVEGPFAVESGSLPELVLLFFMLVEVLGVLDKFGDVVCDNFVERVVGGRLEEGILYLLEGDAADLGYELMVVFEEQFVHSYYYCCLLHAGLA